MTHPSSDIPEPKDQQISRQEAYRQATPPRRYQQEYKSRSPAVGPTIVLHQQHAHPHPSPISTPQRHQALPNGHQHTHHHNHTHNTQPLSHSHSDESSFSNSNHILHSSVRVDSSPPNGPSHPHHPGKWSEPRQRGTTSSSGEDNYADRDRTTEEDEDDKHNKRRYRHSNRNHNHQHTHFSPPHKASSVLSSNTGSRRCSPRVYVLVIMSIWLSATVMTWLGYFLLAPGIDPLPHDPSPLPLPPPPVSMSEVIPTVFTADDVTFFSAFIPEPVSSFIRQLDPDIDPDSPAARAPAPHASFLHAIYSWSLLVPNPRNILIFVQSLDHCALLSDLPLEVSCRVSACWHSTYNVPSLRCILEDANRRAHTPLMAYVEDHIVLFGDILPAFAKISQRLSSQFFLVGSSTSLTLTVDASLDLAVWHHDLEAALFLDSSTPKESDHDKHESMIHSHALHYFAYTREDLDISALPADILMGAGQYFGHHWEKILVAFLLIQDRLKLVDVTRSVTAVELTHEDNTNTTLEINEYNSVMMTNHSSTSSYHLNLLSHLSLGRLENSHLTLLGKCPTCSLKENREADLPLILIRHANPFQEIIVLTTNYAYLPLALNWICRAQLLGINNIIFLAEDRLAYRILRKMNIPVVLRDEAPYKKPTGLPGTAEFHETLYYRTIFIKQIIDLGFHVIYTHLDTIWYENFLPDLLQHSLLAANTSFIPTCDLWIHVGNDGTRLTGEFMSIRSNTVGMRFMKEMLACEDDGYKFIRLHGKNRFFYSDDMDNDCLQYVTARLVKRRGMKRCALDVQRYVSERQFFDLQSSQRASIYPAMVHMKDSKALENKTRQLLDWRLWLVNDTATLTFDSLPVGHTHGQIQCKAPPAPIPSPTTEGLSSFRIIINILASVEYEALSNTFTSLLAADYDPNHVIDLRIVIQQPEHDSTSATQAYIQTARIARDFEWPNHIGNKHVIYVDHYIGPTEQWIDYWAVDLEETQAVFQLALQPGTALSPVWFTWVKAALVQYYYDPFQYQPNLMAIHLMHTFTIVGESPTQRFGSKIPANALNVMQSVYHYQFVPLFGTLFFPKQFHVFLHWYAQYHSTRTTTPSGAAASTTTTGATTATTTTASSSSLSSDPIACVPTMVSNSWYRNDPIHNWWQWLVRFTFESGYYALYVNYQSFISASKSNQLQGVAILTIPSDGHLTAAQDMIDKDYQYTFPPSSTIVLYDLHFNEVKKRDKALLGMRRFMFPPTQSATSKTGASLSAAALAAATLSLPMKESAIDSHSKSSSWWDDGRAGDNDGDDVEQGVWAKVHALQRSNTAASMTSTTTTTVAATLPSTTTDSAEEIDVPTDVLTSTELVVDLIRTMTNEAEDSDATSKYAGELEQTTRKVVALQRYQAQQRLVHPTPIRGQQLDRCFIIADRVLDEPVEPAAAADALDSLPFPYNMSFTLTELYSHIYASLTALLPTTSTGTTSATTDVIDPRVQFIVYRPKTPFPFDRHLRGIYFTFLTALITQRIFLLDLPEFEAAYSCPFPDVKWSYSAFKSLLLSRLSSNQSAEIEWKVMTDNLRTKWIEEFYPEQVLYHVDAVSHDRLLFTNVGYKPYALALFETYSRMKRTGMIMSLLQSKPKNSLIQAGKDLQRILGFNAVKYALCVHVVAPPARVKAATEWDPLPGVGAEHWECIKSQLIHLGFVREDSVIFFTANTNVSVVMNMATHQLDKYGHVVTNMDLYHPQLTNWGVCNATVKASVVRDPVSNQTLYDPYIVNHYVFGDCDVTISSGTTYGIFGAARTGFSHRAYLYKAAPPPIKKDGVWIQSEEKDYCGHMHRIDLPSDNDIPF